MAGMGKKVVREISEASRFICTVGFWRMAVLWIFSLLISYFKLLTRTFFSGNRDSYTRCPPLRMPPSTTAAWPICIITGATSGLGAAAAHALSKEGFYIILAGRSSDLLSKTVTEIKQWDKDAHIKCFQVDFSSFCSILKFVESLKQWLSDSDMHHSVQLLINNAGILATSCRFTVDGHDQMMGTNYMGAFSVTKLLLPLLENSPIPSRIINVTSFTHLNVFNVQINKETVSGKCFSKVKQYPCAHIYEFSKLCLLLFSYELHRQLALMDKSHLVSVNAADPGAVETNIMREIPSYLSHIAFIALKLLGLLQPAESGVSSILDAALAPPEISGAYFFGGKGRTINSSALSYSTRLAEKLWATSSDLFLELRLATDNIPSASSD
ncbi:uncharacterized protein LOC131162358 isoform X2 [Malania oleifera]|uniref:uncharacterized protein LOC131162358 isoform X2 n=1 Tax=Malania oleifera TaxID=397392 RepID=UPI0025AE093D|nr:uncharacterized protein LOC131162358 isoform X2 [Malania oleifera]